MAALAGSKVVSAGIGLLGWFLVSSLSTIVVLVVALAASLAFLEMLGRALPVPAESPLPPKPYRLTPYEVSLLCSFAVTWGLSAAVLMSGEPGGLSAAPTWVVGVLVAMAVAALFARGSEEATSFGRLVRWSVALAAAAWASVPVLSQIAGGAVPPLLEAVLMMQGIAMSLFSVEMCRERGMVTVVTITLNYALVAAAGAAATLVGLATRYWLDGPLMWEVLALAAALASASVVPFLPSSRSGAAAFADSVIPGESSAEQTAASRVEEVAAKYALTARERDVMARAARGMKAQEIADELGLSVWTVKDYLKSVYEKCGVHGATELVVLVTGPAG